MRRAWLAACMGVAAVRLLLGLASFPVFGPLDEHLHFDMVVRYARHAAPQGRRRLLPATAAVFVECESWEYVMREAQARFVGQQEPSWRRIHPAGVVVADVMAIGNAESFEPPVYYAVAGAWMRIGEALGQAGCRLVYWVRLLNVFIYLAVMVVAAAAAREWYPDRPLVSQGMAAVLAVLPQDIFMFVGNNPLMALWGGGGFWLLARGLRPCGPAPTETIAGAACLAAAVLTKIAAVPVAGVILLLPIVAAIRAGRGSRRAPLILNAALAVAVTALPIAAWMRGGGPVAATEQGLEEKVRGTRGMTRAPWAESLAHPILRPSGAAVFTRDLLVSFWLGETFWHGRLPGRGAAGVLVMVTTVCAMLGVWLAPRNRRDPRRILEGLAWTALGVMAAAMALFSLTTDFSGLVYPSPAYPYLTSGRLAITVLVPFLLAWLAGLDRMARGLGFPRAGSAFVGATLVALAWQSTAAILRTAPSAFNWFHLP